MSLTTAHSVVVPSTTSKRIAAVLIVGLVLWSVRVIFEVIYG